MFRFGGELKKANARFEFVPPRGRIPYQNGHPSGTNRFFFWTCQSQSLAKLPPHEFEVKNGVRRVGRQRGSVQSCGSPLCSDSEPFAKISECGICASARTHGLEAHSIGSVPIRIRSQTEGSRVWETGRPPHEFEIEGFLLSESAARGGQPSCSDSVLPEVNRANGFLAGADSAVAFLSRFGSGCKADGSSRD